MFWQDLAEWDHWTDFKKIYMKEKEKKDLKEERRKKRESRWGKAEGRMASSRWEHDEREIDPGLPVAVAASVISIEELQIIQFRMRMQELTDKIETVEADAARISNDPNRSPSPPPEYDKVGNRTNTRAQRMRTEYEKQRGEIMDEVVKLNPILKAIQPKAHCQVKIYFPIKDYPGYNFLGLIIGPRGSTHRQLEQQTHCKIVIRGRGTGREGKSNYELIAQDDDPHVMITGDNEDDVAEAERIINELLQPLDDDKNIHKQKQMKQLAELNGLHEMNARCPYCGMTGHDQFKCPNRPSREKRVAVRGSGVRQSGHPMRDLRRCRAYRAGLSESERQAAVGGASPHERRIHVVHERFGIGTRAR